VEAIERFWIAVAQLPKVARGGRHPSRNSGRLIPEDTMNIILIIIILLLLFGGGGGFYYGGPMVGGGIGGVLLIVLIVYLLMGRR
jgi:hypothetical protein